MKQRYLTALILIPFILFIIVFLNRHVLNLIVAAAVMLAIDEYARMQALRGVVCNRLLLGGGVLIILLGAAYHNPLTLPASLFAACTLVGAVTLVSKGEPVEKAMRLPVAWLGLLIAFLVSHMMLLRSFDVTNLNTGRNLVIYFLGVVWLGDTAAYHVGKAFGRHKLSPLISPKKTVEGLFGCIAGSVIASIIFTLVLGLRFSPNHMFFLGLGIALLGQLGDLLESVFKRGANMKDSSGLIPGHGGLFDRIDSLYLTAPFLYYYCRFIIHL